MSFKAEVLSGVANSEWRNSSFRFATRYEAEAYAANLMVKWAMVYDTRVTPCSGEVTHSYHDHVLVARYLDIQRYGDKLLQEERV